MEIVSDYEQVIWGASLGMATEEELKTCYEQVKEFIYTKSKVFSDCEDAKGTKNLLDVRWLCGEAVHGSDLCNKKPSIKKEHLAIEIECMVLSDVEIDGEKIIKVLREHEYISICHCGKVFFVR